MFFGHNSFSWLNNCPRSARPHSRVNVMTLIILLSTSFAHSLLRSTGLSDRTVGCSLFLSWRSILVTKWCGRVTNWWWWLVACTRRWTNCGDLRRNEVASCLPSLILSIDGFPSTWILQFAGTSSFPVFLLFSIFYRCDVGLQSAKIVTPTADYSWHNPPKMWWGQDDHAV